MIFSLYWLLFHKIINYILIKYLIKEREEEEGEEEKEKSPPLCVKFGNVLLDIILRF